MTLTTKHVEHIDTMASVLAGTRDWPFKVSDVDEANTLLETAVGLLVTANGTFDANDDAQMLDASRTALTLIDLARGDGDTHDDLGAVLPTNLRECRAVLVVMARLAAQAFEAAGDADDNITQLRTNITEAELDLANPTDDEGDSCHD